MCMSCLWSAPYFLSQSSGLNFPHRAITLHRPRHETELLTAVFPSSPSIGWMVCAKKKKKKSHLYNYPNKLYACTVYIYYTVLYLYIMLIFIHLKIFRFHFTTLSENLFLLTFVRKYEVSLSHRLRAANQSKSLGDEKSKNNTSFTCELHLINVYYNRVVGSFLYVNKIHFCYKCIQYKFDWIILQFLQKL